MGPKWGVQLLHKATEGSAVMCPPADEKGKASQKPAETPLADLPAAPDFEAMAQNMGKLVEQAEKSGDDLMRNWAHNSRVLLARPDLFVYRDWCEGGLVRENRRL